MEFVSYAQNHEDVVLRRAFLGQERGFYVDVGAASPDVDSVTKLFYDAGWSGINIEPNPALAAALRQERPRDVTLEVGISDSPGQLVFHECQGDGNWGISTFDGEIAQRHRGSGFEFVERDIPVVPLRDVLASVPVGHVDFLKIDVEGWEREVLLGADLAAYRPRVVVIESTLPLSDVESSGAWEDILVGAGYRRTLFDGLNLFFVHREAEELARALSVPANVLDHYLPAKWVGALIDAGDLVARLGAELDAARAAAPAVASVEEFCLDEHRRVSFLCEGGPDWEEVTLGFLSAFDEGDDVTLVLWLPCDDLEPLAARLARLEAIGAACRDRGSAPDVLVVTEPRSEHVASVLRGDAQVVLTGRLDAGALRSAYAAAA